MTVLREIRFVEIETDVLATAEGRVAVIVPEDGKLDVAARRLNRLTRGALERAVASDKWTGMKEGEVLSLMFPAGMAAQALDVVRLSRNPKPQQARAGGAALARATGTSGILICGGSTKRLDQLALGLALRGYRFTPHMSAEDRPLGAAVIACTRPEENAAAADTALAIAEGVTFTRDLVNEPANVLTTTEFADRLEAMRGIGLEVDVLEEDRLEELGMRALLCVGQGSETPSKVVVMRWKGGDSDDAPLALVGKGVVFDTGGISLKPAGGMEDMTMDMGGAGVVAGVMRTLALRKAKANVVGLVGLVENMPSGNAVRPGDVVTSMKGDTIEVVNTDAEGRLVLCDVMWYAQETYRPAAMIDLATLTGACIIALGHELAATYANDEPLAAAFLKSAEAEGEGAWRMPLGDAYDAMLKSPVADMKNIGGRPAGSVTAAMFLKRFVQDNTPWIHLDIAGVAHVGRDLTLSPKGATGWGVMALNRLVADAFETPPS